MRKGTWKHGTSGYRYKCRCEICVNAQKAARNKNRPLSDSAKVRLDATPLIERLAMADQLDQVDPAVIRRWERDGIDVYWADKWCLKFGWHPANVFGQAFYAGCFDEEFAA